MNEEETELENCLKQYKQQLLAVESALITENNNNELKELKLNLQELIQLTEENLLSIKKKLLFAAIAEIENNNKNAENPNIKEQLTEVESVVSNEVEAKKCVEEEEELSTFLTQLEGHKCRAPHKQEWGELAYHNAIVLNVKPNEFHSTTEIEVEVMFCNPTCDSMKPCSFFMEGHCRFDSQQCRFSHGYSVQLSELQEFLEPDYSILQRDAVCLAKYKDGLWYRAVIEKVEDNFKYSVKYSAYNELDTLEMENILPIAESPSCESDDDFDDDDDENENDSLTDENDVEIVWIKTSENELGNWEQYTKGMGSKLMAQMGYIKGQGLGKNGQGRIEPVEVVVLPQGKSLDKCAEIRERKTANKEKTVQKENAKRKDEKKPRNIFDFINSKMLISSSKKCSRKNVKTAATTTIKNLKESSAKGLNVRMLEITEDLKKAEKELNKLKQSLARNTDKDKKMQIYFEERVSNQEKLIKSLQSQEKLVWKEQSTRKDYKKITVF